MRGLAIVAGLALGIVACRPASYEKDVQVKVPTDSPSDGPGAEPSARVLYPDETVVQVKVPKNEPLPRGVRTGSQRR